MGSSVTSTAVCCHVGVTLFKYYVCSIDSLYGTVCLQLLFLVRLQKKSSSIGRCSLFSCQDILHFGNVEPIPYSVVLEFKLEKSFLSFIVIF